MLYYNTGSNTLFVWNGSSWSAIDDDEIYLGGFAVAPTLNNQGLPLQLGNLYWNSVTNNLWAYDGAAWGVAGFNEFTPFLATGTTFARNLSTRMADVVNVKDFGAVGDGVADDTAAIQAALNVGRGVVFFPAGVYVVTNEVVVPDGSGIIGAGAHWKRRSGYSYSSEQTVIKYNGAGGVNSCVVRFSEQPVGVPGSDFTPPGTDDLVDVIARDFHIDANNLAEIGCYVYRCGNQATFKNITAEKAKLYNHVHLGCFAAEFGTFGSYNSEQHGVACGWNIFNWSPAVESTNFAYVARFLTTNNGTAGTYSPGGPTDLDGSGGLFSVGRGSRVYITSEGNNGRACILSQLNIGGGASGPSDYFLEYLEANKDGPYIDYRDGMDGIRLRCGFIHPGNPPTLLPQNIKIESKTSGGVVTPNSGPNSSSEWLLIDGALGDLSGVGFDIDSNTYKYNVTNCSDSITYSGTQPAVVKNSDNYVNAGVYFTAENASPPTTWKAINGTISRTGVGQYLFTFTHPFKTAGAFIPQISIVVDAGAPFDTKARLTSISTASATINVYDGSDNPADTGDRISFSLVGTLQ
jgi:hypothetical protein